MLANVLDAVLGSTTKVQLLRALLPLTSSVSGREAKHLAGVSSHSGFRTALSHLVQLGILREERTRGSRLYRVNREHHLVSPLQAVFAAESRRVSALREILRRALEISGLLSRVHSVILYGSAARGDARPGSDLDLLFVIDNSRWASRVRDAVQHAESEIASQLGAVTSPLVMPIGRFRRRYRAGDPLLANIETEGRVLLGSPVNELAASE